MLASSDEPYLGKAGKLVMLENKDGIEGLCRCSCESSGMSGKLIGPWYVCLLMERFLVAYKIARPFKILLAQYAVFLIQDALIINTSDMPMQVVCSVESLWTVVGRATLSFRGLCSCMTYADNAGRLLQGCESSEQIFNDAREIPNSWLLCQYFGC